MTEAAVVHYLPPATLESRPRRAGKTTRQNHIAGAALDAPPDAFGNGWSSDPDAVTCPVCRAHLEGSV